jgi:YhcH/YjgK/YiaL family protein
MIYDKIENLGFWAEKIPSLEKALLASKELANAPFSLGKTVIDGDALFANSMEYETKDRKDASFENHHVYIDVQMMLSGTEAIDVLLCSDAPRAEYSSEKDIEFLDFDESYTTITLHAGEFVLLSPGEWHRPSLSVGENSAICQKIVVKIQK